MSQPIRAYPLLPVNEASVYVLGEKAGHKVYPGGGQMHGNPGQGAMPPATIGLGMNYSQQQAMLAQQNSTMESLERRRERERERERTGQRNDPAAAVSFLFLFHATGVAFYSVFIITSSASPTAACSRR